MRNYLRWVTIRKTLYYLEANEWSAEKIQRAIGAKSLELVNHGMTENEAKIFIASLLNLDRALANKNF